MCRGASLKSTLIWMGFEAPCAAAEKRELVMGAARIISAASAVHADIQRSALARTFEDCFTFHLESSEIRGAERLRPHARYRVRILPERQGLVASNGSDPSNGEARSL